MLLGQGLRVLHMQVRTVMVVVMVRVDGVLRHSPLRHPCCWALRPGPGTGTGSGTGIVC